MKFKPWYFLVASVLICILLSVCVWRVVSSTLDGLKTIVNSGIGKPYPVVIEELRRYARGDLVLAANDDPANPPSVVVYRPGNTPTSPPHNAVAGLGIDEQGIVRQVWDIMTVGDGMFPSAGIVQVVSLKA